MKKYFKLARIHHWIKNLLIAVPLICSGQLLYGEKIAAVLWGMIIFSLVSSAIYIFNDICDAEADRKNPLKCRRPIASGEISVKKAAVVCGALLALATAFIAVSGTGALFPILYAALNIAYSMKLKRVPVADITALMSCYLIRVMYGAAVIEVPVSDWLYLTVISAAFFFALGKRRNEISSGTEARAVLKFYTRDFLDKNMYVCLALTNVFYALWAIDVSPRAMIWTVPLVIIICMRYTMNLEAKSSGDPVDVLLHDKVLLVLCGAYAAAFITIITIYI